MYFVGIDIAKAFSVCCVVDEKEEFIIKPFPFNSSTGGFKKLINHLESVNDKSNIVIGMEATGLLFENLYRYLTDLNYNVILLNPYQTSQFRNMDTMKYVKNDNIDSLMIALLIKSGRYSKGYVNEEQLQSLKVLFRHKENIKEQLKSIKRQTSSLLAVVFPELDKVIKDPYNVSGLVLLDKYPTAKHFEYVTVDRILNTFRKTRGNNFNQAKAELLLSIAKDTIYSGVAKEARAFSIRANVTLIKALQEQIKSLEDEMINLFNKDYQADTTIEDENYISSVLDNLRTIPGVSDKTIAAILGECGDLKRFKSAKAFIGYLGLYPTQYQSGNSISIGTLAKRGVPIAKHALYMAAVSSVLHNQELRKIFRDKLSLGKSKKEALIIISKKLATIIYSIFKYNTPYDSKRVLISL
jgi:transposase